METADCVIDFKVMLRGKGKTFSEAWMDASESFSLDPGSSPDDNVSDIDVVCAKCDCWFTLKVDGWVKPAMVECPECDYKQLVHL